MYLSIKEIAQNLNVSEETVRRWIRDKKLKAKDMGGRLGYRITETDFKEFIKNRSSVASTAIISNTALGCASIPNSSNITNVAVSFIPSLFSTLIGFIKNKDTKGASLESKLTLEKRQFEIEQELIAVKAQFEQKKIAYEAKVQSLSLELNTIKKLLNEHFNIK